MEKLYVHATLKVRGTKGYERFCELMAGQRAILEASGWRMIGAWRTAVGPVFNVIHVWEIESANAYFEATAKMRGNPAFDAFKTMTSEVLDEEIVAMLRPTPYSPPIQPIGSAG